jgi:hypothetical protein
MSEPTFPGMARLRRLLVLLAAVGAVAVAAGCGGAGTTAGTEPLTADQLAQAASASVEAQSSKFALDFDMTFPGAPGSFALLGEGAFDATNERATMSLDLSSLAGLFRGLLGGLQGLTPAPGQGAPDFSDPEQWKLDLIVDGKVAYMRFPAMSSELPEGKTWVRIDEDDAAKAGQDFGFSGLEHFTSQDPRELLEVLDSVSGEIETVGAEDVRGTPTTHYRATLDLRELGNLAPSGSGSGGQGGQDFGAMFDQLFEQAGFGELPFDVWIDDEGLVRKVEASFSMAPEGEREKLEASLAFELYDYGVEVDVMPPPADEVADASALKD